MFQHTAARRRLVVPFRAAVRKCVVSTHSRPKAAGQGLTATGLTCERFNTQPPEGGWRQAKAHRPTQERFQHTAARRRLGSNKSIIGPTTRFQHTAARRRLAAVGIGGTAGILFQHTAARRRLALCAVRRGLPYGVSTHSRPKAAGSSLQFGNAAAVVSTHSRPKAAGALRYTRGRRRGFQHTAARRRLGRCDTRGAGVVGFNTQPPEGGWTGRLGRACIRLRFNTQPPEGGWGFKSDYELAKYWFQHTAARRRLADRQAALLAQTWVSTHSRPKAAGGLRWRWRAIR